MCIRSSESVCVCGSGLAVCVCASVSVYVLCGRRCEPFGSFGMGASKSRARPLVRSLASRRPFASSVREKFAEYTHTQLAACAHTCASRVWMWMHV